MERTSYCILNLACSANRSSPFHKKAERKLRVLGCKPNQTHVLIYPSCLHQTFCSFVLMFLCLKIHTLSLVLMFSCLKIYTLSSCPSLLPDKLKFTHPLP